MLKKTLATAVALFLAAVTLVSAKTPLRIAYPSGINGQLAKVIEKGGFAENHGFTPTFTFFQYGPPMIEAVAAGEIDLLFTSFNPTASYLAKKSGSLVIIADVGVAKHAVVVPQESSVKTLADLKGKSIGISFNSDLHVDVLRAIKELKLNPESDFKLVNLQPQELAQSYEQRLTDAVDIRIPPLLVLQQKKGARIVQEWPWQLLVVVSADYLSDNGISADSLREVIKDGLQFIATNPDQAAAWWADHLRLDPKIVRASADLNPLNKVADRKALDIKPGKDLKARATQWAQNLVDLGIQKDKVKFVFK